MFWIGVAFFVWMEGFGPRYFAPNGIGAIHVALTTIFMHGWHPETFTSVVPGGWSIAVEMTFYLLFPVIVFFIRGLLSAVIGLVLSIALAKAALTFFWAKRTHVWPGVSDDLISTLLNLWFPNQIPVFMVGFLVYFAIRDCGGRVPLWLSRTVLCGAIAAAVTLTFILKTVTILGHRLDVYSYAVYGICFGVIAFCLAEGAGMWLVNAPIRFLGKVSFSAYLIHFAVLQSGFGVPFIRSLYHEGNSDGPMFFVAYFPFLVAVTGALSSVTYRFIEQPMIALGNRLISQHGRR